MEKSKRQPNNATTPRGSVKGQSAEQRGRRNMDAIVASYKSTSEGQFVLEQMAKYNDSYKADLTLNDLVITRPYGVIYVDEELYPYFRRWAEANKVNYYYPSSPKDDTVKDRMFNQLVVTSSIKIFKVAEKQAIAGFCSLRSFMTKLQYAIGRMLRSARVGNGEILTKILYIVPYSESDPFGKALIHVGQPSPQAGADDPRLCLLWNVKHVSNQDESGRVQTLTPPNGSSRNGK